MRPLVSHAAPVLYETAAINPPDVELGNEFTIFGLGRTNTDPAIEVSIHTNLICSVSNRIKKSLPQNPKQEMEPVKLPWTHAQPFNVLVRWLYRGQIPIEQPPDCAPDYFWAMVFLVATHFKVSALRVMAFDKFEACFSVGNVQPITGKKLSNPSPELLARFFQKSNPHNIIQNWIIDHMYWAYKCMPSVFTDAEASFKSLPSLRERFCDKLFTGELHVYHAGKALTLF